MFLRTHFKGEYVPAPEHLAPRYQWFLKNNTYGDAILGRHPEIARPMIQTYHGADDQEIYSVSGFIDRSGDLFVARAARKVMQRPRRIGVGVCFEGAPLDPRAAEGVRNLCRSVGYFGAFEVELLRLKDRFLLIDFNPRFYHQIAFDIARGMPLPFFVYLGALGEEGALRRSVAEAIEFRHDHQPAVFCNRFGLAMLMMIRSLGGRMNAVERQHWRDWMTRNRDTMVDAALRRDDRLPGIVDRVNQALSMLRRPRSYLHDTLLD
jgi:predicted ATP-grasp superfamily ATP-dependent carboligase